MAEVKRRVEVALSEWWSVTILVVVPAYSQRALALSHRHILQRPASNEWVSNLKNRR